MWREYFAKSPLMIFPLISLVVFMGVFLTLVVRVLLGRRNPQSIEQTTHLAQLPLDDE